MNGPDIVENSQLRVFHGLTGAAGQAWINSRAQRKLGIKADVYLGYGNPNNYSFDFKLPDSGNRFDNLLQFFSEVAPKYDVFHFYTRPVFYFRSSSLAHPTALDLLCLKAAGKVVIFHYRGSEVRTPSRFKSLSPFNYVGEDPKFLFSNSSEEKMKLYTDFIYGVCDRVLVPDPELQSYVPEAQIVERSCDLAQFPYVGPVRKTRPLVVHAPSHQVIKGTKEVLQAVSELHAEGLEFDFELIEGLSNQEATEKYKNADIVIDQLRIGWYGVLAVECFALGKPVIAYIRDDLWGDLSKSPPLVNANPNTIKTALKDLILNAEKRKTIGERARKYCEDIHDADKIALRLQEMYAQCLAEQPKTLDFEKLMAFLKAQQAESSLPIAQGKESWFKKASYSIRTLGVKSTLRVAAERLKSSF